MPGVFEKESMKSGKNKLYNSEVQTYVFEVLQEINHILREYGLKATMTIEMDSQAKHLLEYEPLSTDEFKNLLDLHEQGDEEFDISEIKPGS